MYGLFGVSLLNRRVKFDVEVEKKVYKAQQYRSLLRMVIKTYSKSAGMNFSLNLALRK